MTAKEISKLYIRIAFQYGSVLDQLIDKRLVDKDLADRTGRRFTTHWMKKNRGHLKRLEVISKAYVAVCDA